MDSMEVLVIDDEEGMREGIRRVLTKRGFTVDTASNGEEALFLLRDRVYDLAFVDLKMPGIDGFKVTEHINETVGLKTVVIIVSALATVEAAVEVTRHGAFDFLVKPFTPSDLIHVLDRAVQQRNLIREREIYLSQLNSERNYSHQLINSMQEGVIVLNIRSEPVLMNPKAEFYLGRRFSDVSTVQDLFEGGNIFDAVMQVLAPNADTSDPARRSAARVFQVPLASLNRGGDAAPSPATPPPDVAGEEGHADMLQVRVEPLIREDGKVGAIVIINDISDQWKAEQDKNRFVSMVAHELKSPLAAIINYINVILTGMFDGEPSRIHEMLGRCVVRGEALLELIQDLLYINRREAGKAEKSIEVIDLCEVIRSQIDFYGEQAARVGVTLGVTGSREPLPVRADRSDLDRIFMNLISNGIKYNREGGSLTVDMRREGDAITVSFADTGIGMTEEERKNLFQEFYRVRNRKTGSISGTGLGLATVRRVLSEYNGRITVDSVPDEGSTFTVFMPAA